MRAIVFLGLCIACTAQPEQQHVQHAYPSFVRYHVAQAPPVAGLLDTLLQLGSNVRVRETPPPCHVPS